MTPSNPIPAERTARLARSWRLYTRLMLAALVALPLMLLFLKRSGVAIPAQTVIAAMAGFGFAALLGTGLIALTYYTRRPGRGGAQGAQNHGR